MIRPIRNETIIGRYNFRSSKPKQFGLCLTRARALCSVENYDSILGRTLCSVENYDSILGRNCFLFDCVLRPTIRLFVVYFKVRHVTGALIMTSYEVTLRPSSIWLQQIWFPLWGSNPGPSGRESSAITAQLVRYIFWFQWNNLSILFDSIKMFDNSSLIKIFNFITQVLDLKASVPSQ